MEERTENSEKPELCCSFESSFLTIILHKISYGQYCELESLSIYGDVAHDADAERVSAAELELHTHTQLRTDRPKMCAANPGTPRCRSEPTQAILPSPQPCWTLSRGHRGEWHQHIFDS